MKIHGLFFSIIALLCVLGCQQATNGEPAPKPITGPVQGKVNGQAFTANQIVAKASPTVTDAYEITLTGSSPEPPVYFTVGSSPKKYTVTTLGMNGGLAVMVYLGDIDFISFDSGTVTITKVDTDEKEISGVFDALNTTDGDSSLTGTFTAEIQ